MTTESWLQISTAFLALLVLILALKVVNKNYEIKEHKQRSEKDKEQLRKIREETNQYLKEQGYKPKVKIVVAADSFNPSGTTTGRLSSTSRNTSSAPQTSNNDAYYRNLNNIINSSNIE
ncbi:membrane protein [Bacillus phage vB_BcgM]|nr:membrane protein [Bacillus phage vB_BcgM]